jgi:prolyl oligopeptidase
VRVLGNNIETEGEEKEDYQWRELNVPLDMQVTMFGDQFLLKLRSDWTIGVEEMTRTIPSGSLLSVSILELLSKGTEANFHVVFTPTSRVSLSSYTKTKTHLILNTLENVKSRLQFWRFAEGDIDDKGSNWTYMGTEAEASIKSTSVSPFDSDESDHYWLTISSFTKVSCLVVVKVMVAELE